MLRTLVTRDAKPFFFEKKNGFALPKRKFFARDRAPSSVERLWWEFA
jgi:hypothetical protein